MSQSASQSQAAATGGSLTMGSGNSGLSSWALAAIVGVVVLALAFVFRSRGKK